MTFRLYRVPIEFNLYVLARSEDEAEELARNHAADELNEHVDGWVFDACSVEDIRRVEHAWWDAIPYSPDGVNMSDLTCEQILGGASIHVRGDVEGEAMDAVERDDKTLELFNEGGNT